MYVPLPHGNGEQRLNATPVVDAGGGLMVDDEALTADWVSHHVPSLMAARHRLAAMAEAAATLGRRDADDRLAAMVRRAAAGPGSNGGTW